MIFNFPGVGLGVGVCLGVGLLAQYWNKTPWLDLELVNNCHAFKGSFLGPDVCWRLIVGKSWNKNSSENFCHGTTGFFSERAGWGRLVTLPGMDRGKARDTQIQALDGVPSRQAYFSWHETITFIENHELYMSSTRGGGEGREKVAKACYLSYLHAHVQVNVIFRATVLLQLQIATWLNV